LNITGQSPSKQAIDTLVNLFTNSLYTTVMWNSNKKLYSECLVVSGTNFAFKRDLR
jgi:hypothetical protein